MSKFDKFHRFTLDVDPEEMDEEDRVPTIAKFSEIHEDNKAVLDDLRVDYDELEARFERESDEKETVEEELMAFKEKLAEAGAEESALTKDELMEFSLGRLTDIVGVSFGEASVDLGPEDDPNGSGKFEEDNRSKAGNQEETEDTKFVDSIVGDIPGVLLED